MRQLRYFVQIVESGSLAKASRQLFIAQPALSQQMARLEDEVGKPLLVRSHQGVVPTENGDALYHHAKFMLRQLDQAVAVARQTSAPVSGRVSLGMAPTTVCQLGVPLLEHLREKYPCLRLNVIEGLSGHLEHMIRFGQLDLAILFTRTAAAELAVAPLFVEDLFVIMHKDSPLVESGRTELSMREVAELPLITPSPGHGLRKRICVEFDRINVPLDPVAEIDSLPLLMTCVARGIGATIKPMAATRALGDDAGAWRCLRVSDTPMQRTNYLYSLPPDKLSAAAVAVIVELRALVRDLIETDKLPGVSLASLEDSVQH